MMNDKAPGCYGLPSVFHPDEVCCQECPWFQSCEDSASDRLKRLEEEMDCSALYWKFRTTPQHPSYKDAKVKTKKTKLVELNEYQTELVAQLPKRTQSIAKSLFERGIDVRKEMLQGKNPFLTNKPAFLKPVCNLLLDRKCFTKQSLRMIYKEAFPRWSESTIKTNVTLAVQILTGLGVADDINNQVILRGSDVRH